LKRDYAVELDKLQQDFAKSVSDNDGNLRAGSVNLRTATTTTVNNLFSSPEENSASIASYMTSLYKKNGIVGGTVRYFQSHPTYNYSIYPIMNQKSGYEMKQNLEEYLGVAKFIDDYNIKFYAPYFFKQTLVNGVSFFYKIQDSKGVSFMEFPIDFCRVYESSNSVLHFELDMSKIKAETLGLPNELQKALEAFTNGQVDDEKKWTEGKWYKVSDKGVAFALDYSVMSHGTTISEFASLLIDSLQLETAKSNVEIKDTLDTIRIIHSEIPTDKDGKPLVTATTAKIYDTAMKRALPKGISGITSPLKLTNIPLNGAGNTKAYDTVDKAQQQLFLSTGTPSNLFGGTTTSSNIVKLSIQKDANWLYTKLFPMLENYYNYELSKYKSMDGLIWKMKFVRQSNFTLKDDLQRFEKQLNLGGSRTEFLAANGMSPVEIVNTLVMEQKMIDIDSIMLPKQTSFTMSGTGEEIGRPTTDEPTDDTDRINDAT